MSPQTTYTVEDIANLMRSAKESAKPYVFFTGAGCSISAGIPSAKTLIEEICYDYSTQVKTLSEIDKKNYGKCMAKLTKDERRAVIKPYVDKAKINWAHIALACLMNEGYITRVLTFNFDNILARACGLLGLYPATYDFTSANINLHNLIVEPAIVHLHGQSHGFTQLNSSNETDSHAKNLSEFILTTLNHSPSLFIGYSGSADAFFTQLENKFDGQQRLIWVDYEPSPNEHVGYFLEKNEGTSHHIGSQDADEFLIALAQRLECFPPKLFQNPYEHLLDELKDVIEFPMQGKSNMDILKSTRIRLEEDSKNIIESTKPNLELLLLEGKYDEVIDYSKGNNLGEDEKDYVAWAYIMQGNTLSALAEQTRDESVFKESFMKYQKAIMTKPDMYDAWNNWGVTLLGLAQQTSDESLFRDSFEKYQEAIAIESDRHEAWNNFGNALLALAQQTSDESLFKESFEKYQKAISIKPDNYGSWNNWGIALSNLAKQTGDELLFRESLEKYEKAITIKPDMYDAWNNWGNALLALAQKTSNELLFRESFEKYQKAISIEPDNDGAWNNLGIALSSLAKQTSDELLFRESFEKYEKAITIKPNNDTAWTGWGIALSNLAQLTDNESLFRESFEKYEKATIIKPDNYMAWNGYAGSLLHLAELTKNENLYDEAMEKSKKAEEINPDQVYNLACVLSRKNDADGCRKKLFHAKEVGTLPDNTHLTSDKDLDNVRQLPWFKELLGEK